MDIGRFADDSRPALARSSCCSHRGLDVDTGEHGQQRTYVLRMLLMER